MPAADRTRTLSEATDAVLLLSRVLVGVAAQSLAATEAEVTLPQYRALVALGINGEQNAASLAELLGLHSSTVTRLCDRLCAKGYIERRTSLESRREITLTLSKKGTRLVRLETERRRDAIRQIVMQLDRRTRLDLIDAVNALAEAAEEVRGDAWRLGWTA